MSANLEYVGWQLGVRLVTLAYIAPQSIAVLVQRHVGSFFAEPTIRS
jgi:hypothetical protein